MSISSTSHRFLENKCLDKLSISGLTKAACITPLYNKIIIKLKSLVPDNEKWQEITSQIGQFYYDNNGWFNKVDCYGDIGTTVIFGREVLIDKIDTSNSVISNELTQLIKEIGNSILVNAVEGQLDVSSIYEEEGTNLGFFEFIGTYKKFEHALAGLNYDECKSLISQVTSQHNYKFAGYLIGRLFFPPSAPISTFGSEILNQFMMTEDFKLIDKNAPIRVGERLVEACDIQSIKSRLTIAVYCNSHEIINKIVETERFKLIDSDGSLSIRLLKKEYTVQDRINLMKLVEKI